MFNDEISQHFEKQARARDHLGSPFTARICRLLADLLVADDSAIARRVWG